MRVNCREMAGNKVGEQSIYWNGGVFIILRILDCSAAAGGPWRQFKLGGRWSEV